MNIPDTVLKDYLVAREFVKPPIEVGNYYLEWDKTSYGIPANEIADLRKFIGNLSPYVTPVLFSAASGIQSLVSAKTRPGGAARLIQGFSPRITVSYRREKFSYFLSMEVDGSCSIERAEVLRDSERTEKPTVLQLRWKLGELLFRRQQDRSNHGRPR